MKTHRMRAGRGGDEFKSQTLQINMRHSNRFAEMGCYKLQRHKNLFWLIEKTFVEVSDSNGTLKIYA